MPIEKCDESALFRRMRAASVGGVSTRARQRNGFALVEIARDHHRMDVRLAANRRGVAELRGDEPHRERDVALRFALAAAWTELGENCRGAQRPAPRAKILRAEASNTPAEIVVHIARGDRVPCAVATIAKELRARRAQLSRDEANELAIRHDLSLPNASLPSITEECEVAV